MSPRGDRARANPTTPGSVTRKQAHEQGVDVGKETTANPNGDVRLQEEIVEARQRWR